MLTLFRRLENLRKHIKFTLANGALGHAEANAELLCSDESRSETIEVTEELCDADALLLALLAHASNHVVNIFRSVTDNLSV